MAEKCWGVLILILDSCKIQHWDWLERYTAGLPAKLSVLLEGGLCGCCLRFQEPSSHLHPDPWLHYLKASRQKWKIHCCALHLMFIPLILVDDPCKQGAW